MNQPNGGAHSDGVVAHPLSHPLSRRVSGARGVWDAAVR